MEQLIISSIEIGDDGIIAIASCIQNIEKLQFGTFGEEGITTKGIEALSTSIQNRNLPVSNHYKASLNTS